VNGEPLSRTELDELIARDLSQCSPEQAALFSGIAIVPTKWQLSPWGDQGGGFWAVAVTDGRVIWYNDIEDGFNVSRFHDDGTIPADEYWCNQDSLRHALYAVTNDLPRLGPPQPL